MRIIVSKLLGLLPESRSQIPIFRDKIVVNKRNADEDRNQDTTKRPDTKEEADEIMPRKLSAVSPSRFQVFQEINETRQCTAGQAE